jgi:hypothetical protein
MYICSRWVPQARSLDMYIETVPDIVRITS